MTDASNTLLWLDEPLLSFGHDQALEHPKDGLLLYGPYRNPLRGGQLRIGLISTNEGAGRYQTWSEQISKPIAPRKPGDPNHTVFPGFQAVFGVGWPEQPTVSLVVDSAALSHAIHIEDRHQAIYKAVSLYSEAIAKYLRERSETSVDLWIAVVPEDVYRLGRPKSSVPKEERQQAEQIMNKKVAFRLLRNPGLFPEDNAAAEAYAYELNFHNQLKARLLPHKAAVQVIRETTLTPDDFKKANGMPLRQLQDPATLAWNIATTAFFKAGGQPWKLTAPRARVCYVGVVFKRDTTGPTENHACCGAQMFLDSGDGVVFRGALGPWYTPDTKSFHLGENDARDLMAIIVEAYKSLHDGLAPLELFVHGKTRFSAAEAAGFRAAVPADCKVVCVRIRDEFGLKLYRRAATNIARGNAWAVTPRLGYLWTKGFTPRLQTYPGREVPNPLTVEIVDGSAEIEQVMRDVLALTKLNYNACIYADGQPVTLRFADAVGEILTAGPTAKDVPPLPFRYYI